MITKIDFTPEIKAKIPEYKKRAIEDLYSGKEHDNWKRKDTVEYLEYVYKLGKQKDKPVVIVADNILQYKIFYNLLFNNKMNSKYTKLINLIWFIKNKKKVTKHKLDSELFSELCSELCSELDSELHSELRSELHSELDSELRSELHSELCSELRSELDSELCSELYSELDSELYSELDSELDSELRSELRSELCSELRSELDSELDSELRSELDSELYSELCSELRSELDSELRSELYSELCSELYSELCSELRSELDSELRSELYSELCSELRSELHSELDSVKYNWLFLTTEYTRIYLMWYKFIKDEFLIKCKKEKELDYLYNKINSANISKLFLCKKIVLILRMPKKILRNNIGFHCISNDGAIQYDNQKIHYINGRKISSWIFDKYFNKTLTFNDFVKLENEDEKAGIITLIKGNEGNDAVLTFLGAEIIDKQTIKHTNDYSEGLTLYKTRMSYSFAQNSKGKLNQPLAWIRMVCPSTGAIYLIDTCPLFNDVIECAKFHRPQNIPIELSYLWSSAN